MKRSQMKTIIGNMHPFRTMDMYEAEPLIEDLLTEIERAGMLAPLTMIEMFGLVDSAWEKEDE